MLNDLDCKCVRIYAECDMKASAAARKLFMHRNTLEYHLNKVQEITGLNPKKFHDLVKLMEKF